MSIAGYMFQIEFCDADESYSWITEHELVIYSHIEDAYIALQEYLEKLSNFTLDEAFEKELLASKEDPSYEILGNYLIVGSIEHEDHEDLVVIKPVRGHYRLTRTPGFGGGFGTGY